MQFHWLLNGRGRCNSKPDRRTSQKHQNTHTHTYKAPTTTRPFCIINEPPANQLNRSCLLHSSLPPSFQQLSICCVTPAAPTHHTSAYNSALSPLTPSPSSPPHLPFLLLLLLYVFPLLTSPTPPPPCHRYSSFSLLHLCLPPSPSPHPLFPHPLFFFLLFPLILFHLPLLPLLFSTCLKSSTSSSSSSSSPILIPYLFYLLPPMFHVSSGWKGKGGAWSEAPFTAHGLFVPATIRRH